MLREHHSICDSVWQSRKINYACANGRRYKQRMRRLYATMVMQTAQAVTYKNNAFVALQILVCTLSLTLYILVLHTNTVNNMKQATEPSIIMARRLELSRCKCRRPRR